MVVDCVTDNLASKIGEIYSSLYPDIPSESILSILPVLAVQTVTEENENGESVESHISVPQSLSIAMSAALEHQSNQMNKNGAHSLRKSQLRHHVKVHINYISTSISNILTLYFIENLSRTVGRNFIGFVEMVGGKSAAANQHSNSVRFEIHRPRHWIIPRPGLFATRASN